MAHYADTSFLASLYVQDAFSRRAHAWLTAHPVALPLTGFGRAELRNAIARLVFGEAPADLKERVTAGQFMEPFYVKVDAAGNAQGTFTDKECTRAAADPYVESFVAGVLFAPALEKGKPVDGVARLQLGTLLN